MAHKTTDTIQINLRLKEALRRRVAREAERNKVSMTKQILLFIEDGLERQDHGTLAELIGALDVIVARHSAAHHEQNKLGDAVRVIEALIDAAEGRDGGKLGETIAKGRQVLRMIDAEGAATMRRMHTTGQRVETE